MICNLCPRRCGVERTPDKAAGVCAMPAWPVAARAMLHQWEEPCLVGEHGAGAVFFSGCNLRCKFCQNGVISQEGYGKPITPQRLREIFEELVEQGAACLDLVTPTHFTDAVLEALGEERWPVPVVWNCGGYESVETLKRLEGRVQVYLPDLKYALTEPAKAYSGAADYPETAKAAILEMFRQTGPYRMENGLLKRRSHPASGAAGRTGKHEGRHRLGGGDLPPRRGAGFSHEPVHAPAGGRGQAGPEGDKGGVPGGGTVHGRLRHCRRLHSGAHLRQGGVYPGFPFAGDLRR